MPHISRHETIHRRRGQGLRQGTWRHGRLPAQAERAWQRTGHPEDLVLVDSSLHSEAERRFSD
jgi:hypothetical protein